MSRHVRLGALFVLAGAVIAAPTVLVVARAERGSASFGDTELVGEHRIGSATVDIEIGRRSAPVRADRLAPGDVVSGHVEVTNAGSIPLNYSIGVSGDPAVLAAWFSWWFVVRPAADACPTGADWAGLEPGDRIEVTGRALAGGDRLSLVGDPAPGPDEGDRTLAVGRSEFVCMAVALSPDTPNSGQASTARVDIVFDAEQFVPEATDAEVTR